MVSLTEAKARPIAMSVPDAAKACGISTRQMWRVISTGAVSTRKIGRRTVVIYSELEDYILGLPEK